MEFIEYLSPIERLSHPIIGTESYTGINLMQFIANVNTALQVVVPGVIFEAAYPDTVMHYQEHSDRFKTTITWDVEHMSPQQLGGKSRPDAHSGTREVKPRLRNITNEPDGKIYQHFEQMLQAFIRFDIWALTAREAEDLAQWFVFDFMAHYTKVFGSQEVRFYERKRDTELWKINNKLQTRSLVYYVLLQHSTVKQSDVIERVRARIQNATQLMER